MVIFNSSSIARGEPARMGIYPVKSIGTIVIASNTTLSSATTDTLPICSIPPGAFLSNYFIRLPLVDGGNTLTLNLRDNLASSNTYVSATTLAQGGGVLSMYGSTGTVLAGLNCVTYGYTLRAIGTAGERVAVWASGAQLLLAVNTSATNTSGASALNIEYMIEWTPAYDMGT